MVLTEPCAKKNSEIPVVSFLPHMQYLSFQKKTFIPDKQASLRYKEILLLHHHFK